MTSPTRPHTAPTARARRAAFLASTSGGVAVIFALSLVPMLGAAGAAIDYSRASAAREAVQRALDAAALAGAAHLDQNDARVARIVEDHVRANLPPDLRDIRIATEVVDGRTGVRVSSDFAVPAIFMPILGVHAIPASGVAEARRAVSSAEIAIALDVTGTMRNHIPALRDATRELVDILQPGGTANENVRIALVPYVAAVNVSGHPDHMRWMDVSGVADNHGINFEGLQYRDDRCQPPPAPVASAGGGQGGGSGSGSAPGAGGSGGSTPPTPATGAGSNAGQGGGSGGGGAAPANPSAGQAARPPAPPPPPPPAQPRRRSPDLGSLDQEQVDPLARPSRVAQAGESVSEAFSAFLAAIGPTPAQASGAWPYGTVNETSPVRCNTLNGPAQVNHFELFAAMGTPWAGCVEARPRAGDRDISEQPPRVGDRNSFFVPFLWPDEDDRTSTFDVRNNYLPDSIPTWARDVDNHDRQRWVWKYNSGVRPNVDNASFLTRGPNAACPTPIVPLTSDRARIRSAIADLRAYAASGTNIAEGFVWAWRMLSPVFLPGEARPYDDRNLKYIILMTDGFNEVVAQDGFGTTLRHATWNRSDYSAINYAERRRLGTNDLAAITTTLDERLESACAAARRQGVQVFTVLYDPVGYTDASQVRQLMTRCATTPTNHVYRAASRADLVEAFRAIGQEISSLRLSR